jgi:hypothetical protein
MWCQPVGAALTDQSLCFHQSPYTFLEEEGIALGALDQALFQRLQTRVVPQEAMEQGGGAHRRQRVESDLGVIGFLAPAVLIFGAVVDQQEQAGGGQALHQAIEERLGLSVDPVQVLEHQQQGLHLALPQEQAFERVQGALAALRRLEALPGFILHLYLQQGQEGRQARPQGWIQRQQAAGELLTHAPPVVAVLKLKIGLEQVDDRQIGGGLAIGG